MIIANGSHRYDIGRQVADAGAYRLYLSTNGESDRQYLLQIADKPDHNGRLDRAAYVLSELKRRSDEVEEEYARVKTDENDRLNYALGFPELVDTFPCEQQGGRRINIFGFRGVQDVGTMIPLVNIGNHRVRPDLRTSVWIMGKLLKLLTFTQSEGISVGPLTGSNILIEKDAHYALIFDWSKASIHHEGVPLETRREEIAQAAQSVITLLGGDRSTGTFPDDEGGRFHPYVDYLFRLACGGESKAERAHAKFYELADSLWKPEYYAFTVKPL
jgi:hypothetical protein